jgi:hypothetical protein
LFTTPALPLCRRSDYPGAHPLGAEISKVDAILKTFVKGGNPRIPAVVSLNQYVCCSAIAALSGLRATKPTAPLAFDLMSNTPKPHNESLVV